MSRPQALFRGVEQRGVAAGVDALIVIFLVIATAVIAEEVAGVKGQPFAWAAIALYFIVPPATRWQGTPGKRANGMKITTLSGERIGIGRSALRFVGTCLSWATLGLGFAVSFWNPRRRMLHDYIAGTVVVDAKATRDQVAGAAPPPPGWLKRVLGSLAMALLVALPIYLVANGMNARVAWQTNARNKHAMEALVAALERHRGAHGRYPARLPDLAVEPPRLEQHTRIFYAASDAGERCWLAIVFWRRPGLLPSDDVNEYDCAARSWRVIDYGEMKAKPEGGF